MITVRESSMDEEIAILESSTENSHLIASYRLVAVETVPTVFVQGIYYSLLKVLTQKK